MCLPAALGERIECACDEFAIPVSTLTREIVEAGWPTVEEPIKARIKRRRKERERAAAAAGADDADPVSMGAAA